jgi:hypothetical protein
MPRKRKTKEELYESFIRRARLVFGDLYDYSLVNYEDDRTKVEIICAIHGNFWKAPTDHINGAQGCQKCSMEAKKAAKRSNTEDFVVKAHNKHGNTYDYSKVNYFDNITPIEIICFIHGVFFQRPDHHLEGSGCQECGKIKGSLVRTFTTEEFITEALIIHKGKYSYVNTVYTKMKNIVIITCLEHGDFPQTADNHLHGHGCKECGLKRSSISSGETEWLDCINNPNIIRQYCIRIGKKRYNVDGFDPATNTVYEFNGDFWHGNPEFYNPNDINPRTAPARTFGELYSATLKKEADIKSEYNMLSIWESDWNKLKKEANI